jgi:hypothetical protein
MKPTDKIRANLVDPLTGKTRAHVYKSGFNDVGEVFAELNSKGKEIYNIINEAQATAQHGRYEPR